MSTETPPQKPPPTPEDIARRRKQIVILAVMWLFICGGCFALTRSGSKQPSSTGSVSAPASAGNSETITRAMLGDAWPLTVDSGTLACDGQAVTFTAGGTTYGVNGTALQRGLPEIDPIWAKASGQEGALGMKVSIGPLIDRGLALCK